MNGDDIYKQLSDLCKETQEISSQVSLEVYKTNNLNTELQKLKERMEDLEKLSHELDKQLNEQKTETKNTKKTLMTVGAIVSILVAVFTYYSEYLSDRPSPLEQQKNIDSLWSKYNNLIDRLVDEKHIK
jgi:chromosome segregation ATPase